MRPLSTQPLLEMEALRRNAAARLRRVEDRTRWVSGGAAGRCGGAAVSERAGRRGVSRGRCRARGGPAAACWLATAHPCAKCAPPTSLWAVS
eukprot:COSAG01_NODE_2564_length_7448_cov_10.275238_9_plen_92_part_00